MSLWDVFANAATGGVYGLLEDSARPANDASPPADTQPTPPARGLGSVIAGIGAALQAPSAAPVRPAPCCDRYRLNDGFLVDGVTGLVWKFDENKNAFVEVPRVPAEHKKPLFNALLGARLHILRGEFENSMAVVVSPDLRERVDKDFESQIAKPLRQATGLE